MAAKRTKKRKFNNRTFNKGPSGPVLGRVLAPELKYILLNDLANDVDSAGAVVPLNLLAQGTTQSSRIGNSVLVKRLTAYLQIKTSTVPAFVRVVIFSDEDSRGASPTPTELLTTVHEGATFNRANRKRFTIWRDLTIPMSANTAGSNSIHFEKIFVDFKNMVCTYTSSGGAQANLEGNAIYALWMSNIDSNMPVLAFQSQIRFTDV